MLPNLLSFQLCRVPYVSVIIIIMYLILVLTILEATFRLTLSSHGSNPLVNTCIFTCLLF
jgi:hypothetical protein